MNKTIRKVISSLLIFTFVLSYIPADVVLANYQSIVSDITLSNGTLKGDKISTITVNWGKPSPSNRVDTNAVDGATMEDPEGYNIYYRNGTAKEAYSKAMMTNVTDPNATSLTQKMTLADNSIYSFYVEPYHYHTPVETGEADYLAPNESAAPVEALTLTDITIDAESTNGGFKVTWGNPTYMGYNVFDGYNLYYVPQTSGSMNSTIPDSAPSLTMKIDDPDAVFNPDGTITYTFETSNVIVGQKYCLKIEPLVNGTPIRLVNASNKKVTINGKTYQFTHPVKSREYRYDGAYVKPSLYIKEEGTDNIRLYWNPISSASGAIDKVEIFSNNTEGDAEWVNVGTIAGTSAQTINSWLLSTPSMLTRYKIVITFADGSTMESNEVFYDPAYSDFDPYKPIIHKVDTDTTTAIPSLTMYWQAFLRKPYNEEEEANVLSQYDNLYNDQKLSYKIWVTDDLTNLTNNYYLQNYVIDDGAASFNSTDIKTSDGDRTLAYFTTINQYYSFVDEQAELKPLEGNKIYYIKIMATRDGTLEESEPEYYSVYIPPTGDVIVNPVTMGTPPLRVEEDANGADIVTDKTINITWDTVWFEVYDEVTDKWYSAVGKDDAGNLVFGEDALDLENQDNVIELYSPFDTSQSLEDVKNYVETSLGVEDIPVRQMNISKSNYEIHTVKYNYLEQEGGYEAYYDSIEEIPEDWLTIKGEDTGSGTNFRYVVDEEQAPEPGELSPNTAYVIYMRTYDIDSEGNKIYAYNPSYVVGNTIDTPTGIIVTPPAQVVEAVSSTDTSITVRWEYSDAFEYTLRYSSKTSDYPDGGNEIDNTFIKENGVLKTEGDKTYIYLTINDLFPETTYYVWVNAANSGQVSDWSAPATVTTLELETPKTPSGLGPIGESNLKIINESNGFKYEPIGEDYIIIEWNRLYKDTVTPTTGIVDENGDEVLFDKNIPAQYAVKFNELDANTKYYFRVKTRHIAQKNSAGGADIQYTYVISMADNEDFIDAREYEVPSTGLVDNGLDVLVRESEWSNTVSIFTGKSDSEYDGDFDPNLYPVPDEDYEIIYSDGELSYIFRGPGLDSNGLPNNGADQRFISTVLNDHIYDFSIDLSTYNGEDVKKAKVVIPYSILKALESQKVTLTIKTGNMFTKVDLGVFSDAIKKQNITGINQNTTAVISFVDSPNMTGLLSTGQSYASTPQSVKLTLNTDTSSTEITTLQRPLTIQMVPSNRTLLEDKNVNMYKQVGGSATNWTPINSTYDKLSNKFTTSTYNTGTYTVIASDVAPTTGTISTTDQEVMYNINSAITITDMGTYDPNKLISANQFNNIIWAVIKDSPTVAMNKTLSQDAYTQLGRGKLLVSGTYVTREKGIASLARLYELETGTAIVPSTTLAQSGYSDYASVSSTYADGVNKAIEIGMISGSTIRPKDNMTFGEFFYMLELVILDEK